MQNTRLMIALVIIGVLTGCDAGDAVVSIHPLYDERTLTFESELVGSWASGDDEVWTFERSGEQIYRLVITLKPDHTYEFDAAVVDLAGFRYLDLSSRDTGPTAAPAHIFARLRIDHDSLKVAFLNDKWMKQKLNDERSLAFLAGPQDRTVLTASTLDLQYFFRRNSLDLDFFSEEDELHRKP